MVRKAANDIARAAYKWARQAYYEAHEKPFKAAKPWNARAKTQAAHMKSERHELKWKWLMADKEILLDKLFPPTANTAH